MVIRGNSVILYSATYCAVADVNGTILMETYN